MASKTASPDFGLVLLRVATGALLLHEARELWARGVGPWIVEDVTYRITDAPDWYAPFGNEVLLRYPTLFAWLVVLGTTAAGISFFVGACVRPAATGVVLLMVNVILVGPASKREYAALVAVCALACFVSHAGARMGLDAWLPRFFTWSSARGPASKPRAAAPRK
jgi:uncharacterized membrane protein YphA (DoxX/SURF4 family)